MDIRKRFYVLDSFRGISALLVFLFHMPNQSLLTDNPFINNSGFFVDLFFVLSGFVIYHNYKDREFNFEYSKQFLKRRFSRLVPLHIYTLTILLFLEILKFGLQNYLPFTKQPFESNTIYAFIPQLFLLNSTPFFTGFEWNGANWSVSAEMISYMLFVIVSLFSIRNKRLVLWSSAFLIIFGYLFFFYKFESFNLVFDFNYSFIRAYIGFFIGVLTYKLGFIYNFKVKIKSRIVKNLIEFLALLAVIFLIPNFNNKYYYVLHFAYGFLILIFSMEIGIISVFFKREIFQKIGLWSYSIYLNHIFIIVLYRMIFLRIFKIEGNISIFFELLTLLVLCIYSSYTYKYIEKRFYKNM